MPGERIDVHSMSVQQRADYTYGKVRSLYVRKVSEAEGFRQKTADTPLNTLLNKFASIRTQQNLEQGLTKRENLGADVNQATQTVDLGMAGLFRIGHVHENSMATRDRNNQNTHIQKALGWHNRHDLPISVKRTTEKVHETIHGSAIYWKGETTQDLQRTFHLSGLRNNPSIVNARNEIRTELAEILSEEKWRHDSQERKKAAGIFSSLGMINIQMARSARHLANYEMGFDQILMAGEIDPNPHRIATVSLWSVAYSMHPNYQAVNFGQRFYLARKGLIEFSKVLFSQNYKSALSSMRQAITRKA